jgi:DHA2 family methylenomycin A resistance protein-like MFS transporter
MIAGQVLAAVGYGSLVFVHANSGVLAVSLPLLAVGVGVALAVPSINTAVLAHVGPSSFGIASGVLNTARQIGGVLGVGVFGALTGVAARGLVSGLHVAVVLAAGVTLSTALIAAMALQSSRLAACADTGAVGTLD